MTKRRQEMREKKNARRRRRLEAQDRMVEGVEIPDGAIAADVSKQAPASFSRRYYYKDHEFECADCGKEEVWTAEDQQWYFEVIKAHPASTATSHHRCIGRP
jgi:Probable zinc-ribbon domain